MPTQDFGVYPDALTAGTEVSSTYEGRHVTVTAAELLTSDGSGIATKGLPCVFGLIAGNQGVGVCFNSGTTTDLIAVDTEGIWNLLVSADDDGGAMLVSGGDPLYIHRTTGIISKIRNNATQIPFGYALGQIAAGEDVVIAVKVHWDPISHWLLDQEMLYFGDARDVSIEWNETDLEILPVADDTGSILIGNGTLNVNSVQVFGMTANDYLLYDTSIARLSLINTALGDDTRIASYHGTFATPSLADGVGMVEIDMTVTGEATECSVASSTWVNVVGTATLDASNVNVCSPRNDGVYAPATTTITGAPIAYGGRFQAILTDTDFNWLAMFSANLSVVQTAIFHVNSSPNFGYVAGDHDDDTNIGSIPLMCDIDGGSVKWVRVYDAAA